jgi:hypothetical protein
MAYGMGLTAERVAEKWQVNREDQDAVAGDPEIPIVIPAIHLNERAGLT